MLHLQLVSIQNIHEKVWNRYLQIAFYEITIEVLLFYDAVVLLQCMVCGVDCTVFNLWQRRCMLWAIRGHRSIMYDVEGASTCTELDLNNNKSAFLRWKVIFFVSESCFVCMLSFCLSFVWFNNYFPLTSTHLNNWMVFVSSLISLISSHKNLSEENHCNAMWAYQTM